MENWIVEFISSYGYLSVFLLIMIENVFPPIPSEIILTFGGFMTTYTEMSPFGVIITATLGSLAGAVILYLLGLLLNIDRIEKIIQKYGHILRVKVEDVERAERWFEKFGYLTVFFCRMVPLIRSLISIPAGMSKMKFGFFMLYTTLGTLIWNTVLVSAGSILGENWNRIVDLMDVYSNIVYAIIVVAVAAFTVYWFKIRKRD